MNEAMPAVKPRPAPEAAVPTESSAHAPSSVVHEEAIGPAVFEERASVPATKAAKKPRAGKFTTPKTAEEEAIDEVVRDATEGRPSQEELDHIFAWLRGHINDLPEDVVIQALWLMVDMDSEDSFMRGREHLQKEEATNPARHFLAKLVVENWLTLNGQRAIDDASVQRVVGEAEQRKKSRGLLGRIAGALSGEGDLKERNRLMQEAVDLAAQVQGQRDILKRLKADQARQEAESSQRAAEVAAKAEAILADARDSAQKAREQAARDAAEARVEADAYYGKRQAEATDVVDRARDDARDITHRAEDRVAALKAEQAALEERVARLRGTIAKISEEHPKEAAADRAHQEQVRRQIVERVMEYISLLLKMGKRIGPSDIPTLLGIVPDLCHDVARMRSEFGAGESDRLIRRVIADLTTKEHPLYSAYNSMSEGERQVVKEVAETLNNKETANLAIVFSEDLSALYKLLGPLSQNDSGISFSNLSVRIGDLIAQAFERGYESVDGLARLFEYLKSLADDKVILTGGSNAIGPIRIDDGHVVAPRKAELNRLRRVAEAMATIDHFIKVGSFEERHLTYRFKIFERGVIVAKPIIANNEFGAVNEVIRGIREWSKADVDRSRDEIIDGVREILVRYFTGSRMDDIIDGVRRMLETLEPDSQDEEIGVANFNISFRRVSGGAKCEIAIESRNMGGGIKKATFPAPLWSSRRGLELRTDFVLSGGHGESELSDSE